MVATLAAGILAGLLSRAVDTAAWAPPWIGQVLVPWLALSWLAGAAARDRRRFGPLLGTVALAAVVATYLVVAGPEAGRLWPLLAAITLLAGSAYGWAGAAWRSGGLLAGAGLALLGAALLVEAIGLQIGERTAPERIGFGLEAAVGLLIIGLAARRPR